MIKKHASTALISILIIASFTVLLVLAASEASISNSYKYTNKTSSQITYYTAEACMEEAVLRLENDITFAGTTIILDEYTTCTIVVTGEAPNKTITITSNYLEYTQTFEANLELSDVGEIYNSELVNWEEI